jgi:hypothetical protein
MRAFWILAICATTATAHAEQFVDGYRLKADCEINIRAVESYVAGWHDKREVDGYFAELATKNFKQDLTAQIMHESVLGLHCIPKDARLSIMADAVCEYVRSHPREHSRGAVGLVAAAMIEKYPCK